ncbi:MAG: SMP-30/gluconolactonase/LRE family protein [Actinomycetota bacterium]|nr:SMP-30/gluconolactonase/LRE family protein [Actinomycetota bacterium]
MADTGGSLLGVALDGAGVIYACDAGLKAVVAINPASSDVTELSRGVSERAMVEPNGIAFDASGNLYVTDSGHWGGADGIVFRVSPQGETSVWTREAARFPNGCLVVGGKLLVIESELPGLSEIDLRADGTAGPVRELFRFRGCVPDQFALDTAGNLMLGCYRPDRLLWVAPDGSTRTLAEDPSGMTLMAPTGCTFAGPRLETLVCTNFGGHELLRLPADVPGASLLKPRRDQLPGR